MHVLASLYTLCHDGRAPCDGVGLVEILYTALEGLLAGLLRLHDPLSKRLQVLQKLNTKQRLDKEETVVKSKQ